MFLRNNNNHNKFFVQIFDENIVKSNKFARLPNKKHTYIP